MTPPTSWPGVLSTLLSGRDLAAPDSAWAMEQVVTGDATPAQIAAFAVALRGKGESPAEVRSLVEVLLSHSERVDAGRPCLDVVGTGGDQAHTVNVSTMAAIVAAAAGAPVVKHGNRAASSRSGTADVLEALGIALSLDATGVASCVAEAGIAFCFAPAFHPSMRHAAGPRREIGIPTVFNILGPLANPARPEASLIGCALEEMAPVMAQVLVDRGCHAIVVRGADGLDEISPFAPTVMWDGTDPSSGIRRVEIGPEALGIPPGPPDGLRGGDPVENASVVRDLLDGERSGRFALIRATVLANAAAALVAYDAAAGQRRYGDPGDALLPRILTAQEDASSALDSTAARSTLQRWIEAARSAAGVPG